MKRKIRWHDYITINVFWFALTMRSQVLSPLIIPLLVQQFVGESAKGTYVGIIRLWALMVALLVQALMGMLSDTSRHPWGRRRPFIVAGALGQVVVLLLIGFASGLKGMSGYWVLFALYILSMVASDTSHAATQGLIPDLVPEDKRGRFSAVKALLELPVPLIFVSFVIGRLVSAGNLWGALVTLVVILVVCMLLVLFVPEQPLRETSFDLDWRPFLRLVLMTGAFTLLILVLGEFVRTAVLWSDGLPPRSARAIIGVAGGAAMAVAIGLGVVLSIRIGIGPDARKNPSFVLWVINRLAFLVPAFNLGGFILFFLQERFEDLSQEKAAGPGATAVMFVGIFVLLAALLGGWLTDRLGKKPLIAVGGLLAALGTFTVLSIPQMWVIHVGACLIGAGVGLFYTANWALGTELVPTDQAGRYLGISNLAGAGAGAIGAYLGGPIADSMGYVLLFVIYGMLFLAAGLPLLRIHEQRS